MTDSLYEQIGLDGQYQVWYTTLKRGLKKSKSFNEIKEVECWCKQNKGKINITSASWQVFDIYKEVCSN